MKLKSLTPTIIKIVAFTAVIGVLTYVIIAILQPSSDGASSERSAVFSDASGLKPRDGVRSAGVKVGYVTAIDLKGATAVVHFQLNDDITITSKTTAAVRYRIFGQRYVELIGAEQGKTQGALTQVRRSTKTIPSFDVSTLFNGFKPVFDTLNADEINELQSNLLRVAQGDGRGISPVLKQIANITAYGNQRSEIITNIVTSLGQGPRGTSSKAARRRWSNSPTSWDRRRRLRRVSDRLREAATLRGQPVHVEDGPHRRATESTYDQSFATIYQRLAREPGELEGSSTVRYCSSPLWTRLTAATNSTPSEAQCSKGLLPAAGYSADCAYGATIGGV